MDSDSAFAGSYVDSSLLESASFPSTSATPYPPSSFDPRGTDSFSAGGSAYFDPSSHLSPRSRAFSTSSISSVASSAHSSFYGVANSPDTSAGTRASLDFPPAMLRPGCDAEGFIAESVTGGVFGVSWDELVLLLAKPETTAYLHQDHVIRQLAGFLAVRLEQDPSLHPQNRPSTGISIVGNNFNALGLADRVDQQPFLYQAPHAQEPPLEDSFYAPRPAQRHSPRQRLPEPIRTTTTFVTPLQRAFVPEIDGLPTAVPLDPSQPHPLYSYGVPPPGFGFEATMEDTVSSHVPPTPTSGIQLSSVPANAFNSPFAATTLPHPPTTFTTPQRPPMSRSQSSSGHAHSASQDSLALRPVTLAATRHLRNTNSPYARRPGMHQRTSSFASVASTSSSLHEQATPESESSRSSSVDLSGSDYEYGPGDDDSYRASSAASNMAGGSISGRKKAARPLRPLNRELETYLWNPKKGQLSRVIGQPPDQVVRDADQGAELVTFPPGSYYKVVEDELEILPCDNRNRVNTWLRGQSCVDNCSFRFEGKRPSVIRQHVVSCKARATVMKKTSSGDPLKRLCQLQLDAQTIDARMKNNSRKLDFSGGGAGGDLVYSRRPLPPDPPPSATFTNPHDGSGEAFSSSSHFDADQRSINSLESQYSAGSSNFEGRSGEGGYPSHQSYWPGADQESLYSHHSHGSGTSPSNDPQHIEQAFESLSSTSAFFSFAPGEGDLVSTNSDPSWLADHGLSVPTGGGDDSFNFLPPNPQPTNSFLSMDE